MRLQLKIMILQTFALSVYTGFIFTFFNRYARFGERAKITPYPFSEEREINENSTSNDQYNFAFYQKINEIAQAIRISSQYIPWKNVCRHQAYQAKLLCNYYKIPCLVFIGFKKDKDRNEIQAHAWTIAGGKMITGFCNPEEYIVQSIYRNKWQ